jgi:hypothetical protein
MPNESAATGHDQPRPAATSGDNDFTLTIEEVAERYQNAGHPRTIRSLQRYCVNGHLDAKKVATTLGDKFLVTPQSVARHIAQIIELSEQDSVATGRDQSRPAAADRDERRQPTTGVTQDGSQQNAQPTPPAPIDTPRPAVTAAPGMSRYVERLEREVEMAQDERDFLREQIDRKDKTIDSLLERDRETNFLIRGLQDLIPRLPAPREQHPHDPNSSNSNFDSGQSN